MLNSGSLRRPKRLERALWHNSDLNRSFPLGCTKCDWKSDCGGLLIEEPIFGCDDFCCGQVNTCNFMCPRRPRDFRDRIIEIGGFDLSNIPRAEILAAPVLPTFIPLIFHGSRRNLPFKSTAVCLPLYAVIRRKSSEPRFTSRTELCDHFRIRNDATIILSGVKKDMPLERWWSLGDRRLEVISNLRRIGIDFVTAPNFSVFSNCPRPDNLHNMKRIGLCLEEFLRGGLPCALHLNGRTDHDWARWTTFLQEREEITHIAFEFGTGAGAAHRRLWYRDKLVKLAREVKRPLHLTLRDGYELFPTIRAAFENASLIETDVGIKSSRFQRAYDRGDGQLSWNTDRHGDNQSIDELLAHNWHVIQQRLGRNLAVAS